ncbi:hypothetical protein L615_001100000170 [Nocardioides sp. J9]|uniref:hypothetical protein n=1 Tax=unclassified Nocardioides TaxID=2615069 RepID=UPI00048C6A41|nr:MULTISPECIES: hypothetical protein [unclassified Nocardioides]TWH03862.1 hypothetical protein L615_001100000170 [Nocardioides sp. J9]
MTHLSVRALETIGAAGYTDEEWARAAGWTDGLWRGDECGCDDDRCVGHHHETSEECGCLPILLDHIAQNREAYELWRDYRAAVEANDGRGDPKGYDAAWSRAEAWVRRHHPQALTFSLDAVVNGMRGISATYAGVDPGFVGTTPEPESPGHYRQQLWTEGVDQYGRQQALAAKADERPEALGRAGR